MDTSVKVLDGGDLAEHLCATLLGSPDSAAQWIQANTQVLKSDRYSIAGLLQMRDELCFVKLYRYKSRLQKALFSSGFGRPMRSIKYARALLKEGVPVPHPRGCLLVPEGMLLLTGGISGEGNLSEVWARGLDHEQAGRIMQIAGQTIAQLHLSGFAHGDCKWNNLVWDGHGIFFVDLDGTTRTSVKSARQARDIARFTLSAEELQIGACLYGLFLASYLQVMGESRREVVERMAPFVYKLRARHLARYGPRGQRLV